MALAFCISVPVSISRLHEAAPGSIFPAWSCRFRCSRRSGIRCSAGETPATDPVDAPKNATNSQPASWMYVEPAKDGYAGWSPLDCDYDADRRAGFLQIGAGVALAIAFSLVTYTSCSRTGTKHAIVYSVSTRQQEKDLLSRSNESLNAQKSPASETSTTPSSNDSKQEFHGDNPQPDVASASGLHQKKTAPGQDSFLSKDVEKYIIEENGLFTASFNDSDVESRDEFGHYDLDEVEAQSALSSEDMEKKSTLSSKEVENKSASSPEELERPMKDSLYRTAGVKENAIFSTDDKYNFDTSGSPALTSDLAGASDDKSDVHDSSSESMSEINVLENEKEQSSEISSLSSGSAESSRGLEESNDAKAKHDADPSAELKQETFTVSASLVVPKGAPEKVLEFLGLNTETKEGELDLSAPEPGGTKGSSSVLNTLSLSLGSESWQSKSVEYFGIPAPSAPSAVAQARPGSILVPAAVDHEQAQAVAALQAMKVLEPDVEAGGICTRREYIRWLIAITGTLARSPAQKIFPAMYIEGVSELAFNDVAPDDPDFPYIQGLAEAGLIASNLSRHDANEDFRFMDGAIFLPDSPLSRQDLVSWKVSLEGQVVQAVDKQKLKSQSGFIDFDRISEDVLPFLAKDLAAGEKSVVAAAFGFTRRFQPGKPVTRAQAAIALVTGELADTVAQELTRVEAEDLADAAVVAELALEACAQKHLDDYFNAELKQEKESRFSAEKQLKQMKSELDKVIKQREDQRVSLESVQAAVQAEKDLLYEYRQDLDHQLQALIAQQVEVGVEKERLEALRKGAQEGGQELADKKVELEVEKQALILARLWAEDEAYKARAHSKLLEEAHKRWEGHGIQVRVDKDLDGNNIPALSWQYSGRGTKLNKFLQRPPVQDILEKARLLKWNIIERFFQLQNTIQNALMVVRQNICNSYQVAKAKVAMSLQEVRGTVQEVGEKAHEVQQDTFSAISRKVQEVQDSTISTVAGVASNVTDGTRKIAAGFRGEAQKLAGKFKS